MKISSNATPQISLTDLQTLAGAQLSSKARFGYVALLLVSLAQSIAIGSLWLTEPALKTHTTIALGAMTLIGAAWAVFAAWVLMARRPLLARDGVVAGRMAVIFTCVFAAGSFAIGIIKGGTAPFGAGATGLVMLAVAVAMWVRARRKHAALLARRAELERQIESGAK